MDTFLVTLVSMNRSLRSIEFYNMLSLTSDLEVSSAVDEADVVDGLARVVTLVRVRRLEDVQLQSAFAGLCDEPGIHGIVIDTIS